MTEQLLGLVPVWGPWLLAFAAFAACFAVPVPVSVLMLAAGGFAATGDLSLPLCAAAAVGGAMAGDQAGYAVGRFGGTRALARLGAMTAPAERAAAFIARRGAIAVYLSRWLVSALGPAVNLVSGASGMGWGIFTLAALAGEISWAGLYLGLGYVFAGNLAAASEMALNVLGALGAGVIAAGLGWWLWTTIRAERG